MRAWAVIVIGANGADGANTTAAELDTYLGETFPYSSNVVQFGNGTATYLGEAGGQGWLLTANHVQAPATVTVAGVGLNVGTKQRVGSADMAVYPVWSSSGLPDLPAVILSKDYPVAGDEMINIGFGRDRVEGANANPKSVGQGTGYSWTGTRVHRWGTNHVESLTFFYSPVSPGVPVTNLSGRGESFFTKFDDNDNANESLASSGDSGGPVFSHADGAWKLLGIMTHIYTYSLQHAQTTAFGNQMSSVCVKSYESTISNMTGLTSGIQARYLFYNASGWDGSDAAASAADDAAIATDKVALFQNETATFANYSSYSRGINGVMVDILDLPGTPDASDFEFHVGNDDDPAGWAPAPNPAEVVVRPGEGHNGSNRITITWSNNAIEKQWLQIRVKATAATGLESDDVFYFGNAIGETGNSTNEALVNGFDQAKIRANPVFTSNPATVTNQYDINRDRLVNGFDEAKARAHTTTTSTRLRLITPGTTAGLLAAGSSEDGAIVAALTAPVDPRTRQLEFTPVRNETGGWTLEFEVPSVARLQFSPDAENWHDLYPSILRPSKVNARRVLVDVDLRSGKKQILPAGWKVTECSRRSCQLIQPLLTISTILACNRSAP